MPLIHTTHGDRDEAQLLKRTDVVDTDNEHTEIVEYCLLGCEGPAHRTGLPDAPGLFCGWHVHRSVHVALKRGVSAESAVGGLG